MLSRPVLVTGATGYVGNRLVPRLLERGYKVRACGRSLGKLSSRSWAEHPDVELVPVDVLDLHALTNAAHGCDSAYYLVHSMNPQSDDFAKTDRIAAQNMVAAAEAAGLKKLIYLGGLGEDDGGLSKHLRSRAEVAEILKEGTVPVTIFRAAMIIGSGSASFEILRYLTERLPIMITPRWVQTPSQPIAIRNVLNYLIACLENDRTIAKTFDIGGKEIVTYRDLMRIYAAEAGLSKRLIIPVPVFTPRLSSYWIHLVTPVPAFIARPLADGLRNPAVCTEDEIQRILPQDLLSCSEAIQLALNKTQHHQVESHWTDAGLIPPPEWCSNDDATWAGGTVLQDICRMVVRATPEEVWKPVTRLGGSTGWYYGNWLWRLRGFMDRLVGGVGLRRGRRHPSEIAPGDALDFWRVMAVEKNQRLVLAAEMKVPGEAMLELSLKKLDEEKTEVTLTAKFLPSGLTGILYWYAVSPLHGIVFNGMLKAIAKACGKERLSGPTEIAATDASSLAAIFAPRKPRRT